MNTQNTSLNDEDSRSAPPFTPQGPPPKIGIIRSVLLVLMAAIGTVEIALFSGLLFLRSVPSVSVPTAQITGSNSGFTSYIQPSGITGTNTGGAQHAEPVNTTQGQSEGEPPGEDTPTQNQPTQGQGTPSNSQPPENGNQPEDIPALVPEQPDNPLPDENGDTNEPQPPNQPTTPTDTVQTPSDSSPTIDGTVYWTPNGEKYHSTPNCSTLSRSKTILSGTVDEAIATGHNAPCKRCH